MKVQLTLLVVVTICCLPLAAQSPLQLTAAEQALLEAAFAGDLESVQRLISEGAAVNAADGEGRTPLMYAAFNGHTAVAELLVRSSAKVDAKDGAGRTALMFASSGPFVETVELLLQEGADVNVQGALEGFTPLMTAAAEGLGDVVRLLLDNGADRSIEDQDGDTALSFARENGHSEVVALLVEAS